MVLLATQASAVASGAATSIAVASPTLSSTPPSSGRSPSLLVVASACAPPRSAASGTRSTRFAPALSKPRTRRRGADGGEGGDSPFGDDNSDWFWFGGPLDGVDDGGRGAGSGGYYSGGGGGGGRHGGDGGGGGGWDSSNREWGEFPALAGAAWLWQGICAASLVHSLFFALFPHHKPAQPHAAPFAAAATGVEGLC